MGSPSETAEIVQFPQESPRLRTGCPVCGDRRFFYRASAWETHTNRRVVADCGCMNGLTDTGEIVEDALHRDALVERCNPVLLETVQRMREGQR